MIITLLRFIYLTSPIYVGIEFKTLSKQEKQRRSEKVNSSWRVNDDQRRVWGELRQRAPEITRLQLATANWRWAKKSSTRHGEQLYSRGTLGQPKIPRADVAQTHWWRNINSPWRMELLARRVNADQTSYKSPLDQSF